MKKTLSAKVLPMQKATKYIEKLLLEQLAALAYSAGEKYCQLATKYLSQTFAYWNQSGANKFEKPTVDCEIKVNKGKKGVRLLVRITVIDPSSQRPHFLWHILSEGRREYVFPAGKQSPPIRKRKARRTQKGILKVARFPGYTDEVFVIRGGQTVKAVPGNEWYDAAAAAILKDAKKDALLKYWLPIKVIVREAKA